MKLKKYVVFYVILVSLFSGFFSIYAFGKENAFLITYGKDAGTEEGDDDFMQVIFIRIPDTFSKRLYIRIFDADCGGSIDARYHGKWDTRTRFQLFGKEKAYSTFNLSQGAPEKDNIFSGTLLKDQTYGIDPFKDNQWYNFVEINPKDGELLDNFRYFKLIVTGIEGDDGNIFMVTASTHQRRNIKPDEIDLMMYSTTIHLPGREVFSEMRVFVPNGTSSLTVHNFDLYSAHIHVVTKFRADLPVKSSGQNEWMKSNIKILPDETDQYCGIRFKGGKEMPNDGTFFITDHTGKLLPIILPIYIQKKNKRPEIKIRLEYLADCHSVFFDASQTKDPEGDEIRFYWNFGDGKTGKGEKTTHKYEFSGNYLAQLIVTDVSGQVYNSKKSPFKVKVNQQPVANAGPDMIASPNTELTFDASNSVDKDGNILKYYWNFGDGNKASEKISKNAFWKPDRYNVSLRVEDDSDSPCNSNSDTCDVWINAQPVLEIGSDIIASPGQKIKFSGENSKDSDGKIVSYDWDFGDANNAKGINTIHAYEKPGTYQVTLTIADDAHVDNSRAFDTLNVFVNDRPIANAGKDHHVSAKQTIVFDASASMDSDGKIIFYEWQLGDGTILNGKKVTHSYDQPGVYTATLLVKDNSCSTSDTDKDSAIVIINHPPVADAGPDQWKTQSEIKFNALKSSDNDGDITQYIWNFGDGTKAFGPVLSHVYQSPGIYTVNLTVIDDSNTSTNTAMDALNLTINHIPIADAGPDILAAPGETIFFDGSSSVDPDGEIVKWKWDTGDGHTLNGKQVAHAYKKSGIYHALLTVYDNSSHEKALNFDDVKITINFSPIAHAGKDIVVAPHQMAAFDAGKSYDTDGQISKYIWKFSDGVTKQGMGVKRQFEKSGIYTANLTVVDNSKVKNSTANDQLIVYVNHQPIAKSQGLIFTNQRTILLDASASIDADGDNIQCIWNPGDGTKNLVGVKVFHTYPKGGIYPAILTVDDNKGLSNSVSKETVKIEINERPVANAGNDKTVCAGNLIIFDASESRDPENGRMKYLWKFSDGKEMLGVNIARVFEKGGIYSSVLTVTDDSGLQGGNSDKDQIIINVIESPVANAGDDQIVCAGHMIYFDGTGSTDVDGLVNSYEWDFGDGSTGGGATPSHVYEQAGKYRVALRITGDQTGNCDYTDSDDMIVTVHEAPVSSFTCPLDFPIGETVHFDASTSSGNGAEIIQWEWDFGNNYTSTLEKPTHTFLKSGSHIITLTVTTDSQTECNETVSRKSININAPPKAVPGNNIFAGVNQIITLDGSKSYDPDGAISVYQWDLGDGTIDNGLEISHQYASPGLYKVSLLVQDNTNLKNNTDTDQLTITINNPPVPVISIVSKNNIRSTTENNYLGTFCMNENITFSGADSKDIEGNIVYYSWCFGDGASEKGKEIIHQYKSPGKYIVNLIVDDGSNVNNSKAQCFGVLVINHPPVSDAGPDRVVSAGEKILFDASGAFDFDGQITRYIWSFENDVQIEGKNIFHIFEKPGQYQVGLSVIDESHTQCNKGENFIVVRVNNPPVAIISFHHAFLTGGAHDQIIFDASKSYDPDDDPLTFHWYFGNNDMSEGKIVKYGYAKPGLYDVKLKVDDGTGLSSSYSWQKKHVEIKNR